MGQITNQSASRPNMRSCKIDVVAAALPDWLTVYAWVCFQHRRHLSCVQCMCVCLNECTQHQLTYCRAGLYMQDLRVAALDMQLTGLAGCLAAQLEGSTYAAPSSVSPSNGQFLLLAWVLPLLKCVQDTLTNNRQLILQQQQLLLQG